MSHSDNNKLGTLLREYRAEKKLSLGALAKILKCGRSYVYYIEEGYSPKTKLPIIPSLKFLARIATMLDMTVEELMVKAEITDCDDEGNQYYLKYIKK